MGAYISDNAATPASRTYEIDGTAYCFSVVNPSEFMSNFNGNDLYLSNGNVAGFRTSAQEDQANNLADDPFDALTQTERQAGVSHPLYGGPEFANQITYEDLVAAGDASGIAVKGANFDVVAHFTHAFCTSTWTNEEMQMAGDWGHNQDDSIDYPNGVLEADQIHVHTDTTDKRFINQPTGTYNQVTGTIELWNGRYEVDGDAMTSVDSNTQVRWPNAGAYAGFYSFVACANPDTVDYTHTNYSKFIYLAGDDHAGAGCVVPPTTVTETQDCLDSAIGINQIVSSVGNSMWRYECENEAASGQFTPEMRFNL